MPYFIKAASNHLKRMRVLGLSSITPKQSQELLCNIELRIIIGDIKFIQSTGYFFPMEFV